MLTAIPRNLWSLDFDIQRDGESVARLDLSLFSRSAAIETKDVRLAAKKSGFIRATYTLSRDGTTVARAEKPAFFRDTVELQLGDVTVEIRRKGLFGMQYRVLSGGDVIGSISRKGWLSRRADIALPDDWPTALQVFLFWIVLLFWRRDASSSSGG